MKKCEFCGYENLDDAQYCLSCGADLPKQEKGNGLLIGLVAGVVSVVLVGVVAFLLFYNSGGQVYQRMMEKGNKYYARGQYEEAIKSYRIAISAMPKREEPYIRISESYNMLGDSLAAQYALDEGYLKLGTERLYMLLQDSRSAKAVSMVGGGVSTVYTVDQAAVMSETVEFDPQNFQIFANYVFSDYRRDYGEPSVRDSEGKMLVSWGGLGTKLLYYNTLENPDVINSVQGMPHTYSKPTEIRVDDLTVLFRNFGGALVVGRLERLCGDGVTVGYNESAGCYCVTFQYQGCIVSIESDEMGNILNASGWNAIRPEKYDSQGDEPSEGTTVMSGFVNDATTGLGIYGATMVFRQSGSVVDTITTTGDGSYSINLNPGSYEVEVSYGTYIAEKFPFEIRANEIRYFMNFILSPPLQQGAIRIVLEWGARPYDLDSYASGTFADGSRFNVNYTNQREIRGGNVLAELDVDDTNGFGPETTTINDPGASFTFWIEDFRTEGLNDFTSVTVKVYVGGSTTPTVFTGSRKDFGIRKWNVFSYSNGIVSGIDTYEQ